MSPVIHEDTVFIVQTADRDIRAELMLRLDTLEYQIVIQVHDEVAIETPDTTSLDEICSIMGQSPAWAKSLLLRADGFVCEYYTLTITSSQNIAHPFASVNYAR